ncbi:MAG: type I-U CRISPR-associated RAMP protein Csb1/Cas7u [Chloroflexota bacterium]
MANITYDLLRDAVTAGGPSVLVSNTDLAAAAGPHASVAPARFVSGRDAVYAYERRFIDDEPRHTVIIDSKQSQLNRAEIALQQAMDDGHPIVGRMPHVRVTYDRDGVPETYTDLELPHRIYDGHIRAGRIDDGDAVVDRRYRAARDATPADAMALFEISPITLVFGGWDASRRARQGRWRSALVGEIIGVLADQRDEPRTTRRGGARVDPVAMQVQLEPETIKALADAQQEELSPKKHGELSKVRKTTSGSVLGLGGIPPTLEQLAGVACARIIRSHVLSFATLRQIRFGTGADGDAACRALLAALALDGLARSDAELYLRANCDLVEAGQVIVRIDRREGEWEALERLDIDAADGLLEDAIAGAERDAGISWDGQVLEVTGNPAVIAGATETESEA